TLDDSDRYRGLTLNSNDMIDESYFRMPNLASPNSLGIAPIFNRNITYSKKKDSFDVNSSSFDSYRNMFSFYLFILLFKDNFITETSLDRSFDINLDNSKDLYTINNLNIAKNIPTSNNDIDISSYFEHQSSINREFSVNLENTEGNLTTLESISDTTINNINLCSKELDIN
ncbi:MAG: hypothetical protein ACRC68_09565, partial [Clostridium sp.]